MRVIQGLFAALTLGCIGAASTAHALSTDTNVVLMTLDGVRWDEVFQGTDHRLTHSPSVPIMKHLTGELAEQGMLIGDRENSYAYVSNPVNMSLPGYENIFTGYPTECKTNFCPLIRHDTFPERLIRELGFNKMDAAGFASWSQIWNAFSSHPGVTYLNAAQAPVLIDDPVHADLNHKQATDVPPWNNSSWHARYDKYTFAHGLQFLKTHHPRFLYISLLDADQYGHASQYKNYVKAITNYDNWIKQISDTLDGMGDYGKNTLLIVTTDHGRGELITSWNNHGLLYPYSKRIWMYLRGKGVRPGILPGPTVQNEAVFTHDDIRPTIEKALGLKPSENAPGRSILDSVNGNAKSI